MSSWKFVATWPINDPAQPFAQLCVEANREIGQLARAAGARIVGDIAWDIRGNLLCAEVDAVPAVAGTTTVNATTSAAARNLAVWWLTTRDLLDDTEIADRLGCTEAAVVKARTAWWRNAAPTPRRAYRTNAASKQLRAKVAGGVS